MRTFALFPTRALVTAAISGPLLFAFPAMVRAEGELDALLAEGPTPEHQRAERPEESPAPSSGTEIPASTGGTKPDARAPQPRTVGSRIIEEIIVTAQKTEQNLRDVPISMSVLDDEFIEDQGITDLRALSLYVPNASINDNAIFPDARIRGFGSAPVNKAFEQSVGLVIDGVPYGRSQYFQSSLFDVERVEVLRGPQGTLFGKNSPAGLFSIVTRNPTDELTGGIELGLGELDERRAEAAIGGPLVPGLLNFRIAGLSESRDGFMSNTTSRVVARAAERLNDRDREALRVKLGAPDLGGVNLVVGFETFSLSASGIGAEFRVVPENEKPFYLLWDPDTDFEPENYVGSIDADELSRTKIHTVTANASYDLGGWGLDLVGGYTILTSEIVLDGDFTPAPMITFDSEDDNIQSTIELRATSPSLAGLFGLEQLFGASLGSTDLTGGLFLQRREITNSRLSAGADPVVVAQFLAFRSSPAPTVPPLEEFIGTEIPAGTLGTLDTTQGDEVSSLYFEQVSNSIAGFGQSNWRFAERWTLLTGLRLSRETKAANWRRVTEQGSGAVFGALGWEDFEEALDLSEVDLSPKVSLRWDALDEVTLYAGWARGFKSAGLNEFATRGGADELRYDAEKASSWEVGAKSSLLGGVARVNVGLYWMDLDDFQVLTPLPETLGVLIVENAGAARSRGVEIDGSWLATDWLTLVASVGLNDAQFLDFPFGGCPGDQSDTDGDGDPRCDLTGEPLELTPKWMVSVTPSVKLPLAGLLGETLPSILSGLVLSGGLNVEYQDVQYASRIIDARVRQPSFIRLNGTLGFGDPLRGWDIGIVGQNLTDTFAVFRIEDPSLAAGTYYHIPEPHRLLMGRVRWRF